MADGGEGILEGQQAPRVGKHDRGGEGKLRGEKTLGVLKWLRSREPPCPWGELTCLFSGGGRAPPKPAVPLGASWLGHQHIVDWIHQREDDESDDEEYSDGD